MKFYLLFVALRDNEANLTRVSYDKIVDYTGVDRNRIKSGLSLLAANSLVHIEHMPVLGIDYGVSNAYRLPQLDPYVHQGTRGRGLDSGLAELLGGSAPFGAGKQ
ncbi:hypothetical protein [Acidisoma sp. S159]|uniref:hypothetical protein n=1 Tax=Acidisoma sp. S159 TaxID=1747225 RepID=UPI00131B482A|nr:hypothetical protein [Acidisoma sp. S159]